MAQSGSRPRPTQLAVNGLKNTADATRSPASAFPSSPVARQTRVTLDQAWRDADNAFYEQTGRRLMDSGPSQKKSALDMWKRNYDLDDSQASQKYSEMANLIQTILDGVEVVGAFAAQAASTVFAPAGMCFNAIAFLIDAPRQIRQVYDTLRSLFEEVGDFLAKFKILKRIDDKVGLDEELIKNTNRLLISFVSVCTLSIKILKGHKFVIAAKAVLLKSDSGVGAELAKFKQLAKSQDDLVGTVTLEHVLQNEEDTKLILSFAGENNSLLRGLATTSNDEKTKLVNVERLATIRRKLYTKQEQLLDWSLETQEYQEELLPGTFEALTANTNYQQWFKPEDGESGRSTLLLCGDAGSGKSRVLEALKLNLDRIREYALKDDPSTYVASYTFDSRRIKRPDDKKVDPFNPFLFALKSIALQVASQSTVYAKLLERQLSERSDPLQSIDDADKLWDFLKLNTFAAPPGSSMYLLFDSVGDRDRSKVNTFIHLLAGVKRQNRRKSQADDTVQLRLFFAGEHDTLTGPGSRPFPMISMSTLHESLAESFVEQELRRMSLFQDPDKKAVTVRKKILNTLPKQVGFSFESARKKLEHLGQAIEDDLPSSELDRIINSDASTLTRGSRSGPQLLEALAKDLKPRHIEQVNSVIIWAMYTMDGRFMDIEMLEAALYLEQENDTLEPLSKKMKHKFQKIFDTWGSDVAHLNEDVLAALREGEDIPVVGRSAEIPLITMDISIKNAEPRHVQQFVFELNERIASGKFDWSQNDAAKHRITVNKAQAHLTITRSCLKFLNEEPNDATDVLVVYPIEYLPLHLTELYNLREKLTTIEKKLIVQELIGFLSQPYYFEARGDQCYVGRGECWLQNAENIEAVRWWLQDEETLTHLQPKERRWAKLAVQSGEGNMGHLKQVAVSIAKGWLTDKTERISELFEWLNSYIEADLQSRKPPQKPLEISGEEMAQAQNNSAVMNAQAKNTSMKQLRPDNGEGKTEQAANINNGSVDTAEISRAPMTDKSNDQSLREPGSSTVEEQTSANGGCEHINKKTILADNQEELSLEAGANGTFDDQQQSLTYPIQDIAKQKVENSTDPQNDAELTLTEKIMRAADWVGRNLNIVLPDPIYSINIGYTYLDLGDHTKAIEYFDQVKNDETHARRALVALSRVYFQLRQNEEAVSNMEAALDILRIRRKSNELSNDDISLFRMFLKELAGELEKLENFEKALPLYEEALECESTDVECRWTVLKMLCKTNKWANAIELLEDWSEHSGRYGGETPANALYRWQESEYLDVDFEFLIRAIQDDGLLGIMIQTISEACKIAQANSMLDVQASLLLMNGIAVALTKAQDRWTEAKDIWEDILLLPAPEDASFKYTRSLAAAALNLSKIKFDWARSKLKAQPHMTTEGKDAVISEFSKYLKQVVKAAPYSREGYGLDSCDTHEAALLVMCGYHEKARDLLRRDIQYGIDIMSDEDPENDTVGLRSIIKALNCYGDKIGALTAWSLLDRKATLDLDSNNRGPAERDSVPAPPPYTASVDEDGIPFYCEGCDRMISSNDRAGIWICQSCGIPLCSLCYGLFSEGKLSYHYCNGDHPFTHFYHTKYTDEELAPGRVRIDWKLEDDGTGGFVRRDGRVVEVKEWLDQLRALWNIPESESESRAQK